MRALLTLIVVGSGVGAPLVAHADGPGEQPPPPPGRHSARTFVYVDPLASAGLGVLPAGLALAAAGGLQADFLRGPRTWTGTRTPLRYGPFAAVGFRMIGEANDDGSYTGLRALELAAGGSLLLPGTLTPEYGLRRAGMLSLGVVREVADGADATGVLARASLGVTTYGRDRWKWWSGWAYVEGTWLPSAHAGSVTLGLRFDPLWLFLFWGGPEVGP